MNNPLDRAMVEAKIVRFLLVEGRPCAVTEIRFEGGLSHVPGIVLWSALKSLVDSGLVATTQATETEHHGDFPSSITYPVFWVDRASIMSERFDTSKHWWPALLRRANGKEVQP
jgi:hypothetical protein